MELSEGKRVNNPDEPNIIYIAFHGIPATNLKPPTNFSNLFVLPVSNESKRKLKTQCVVKTVTPTLDLRLMYNPVHGYMKVELSPKAYLFCPR